MSPEKSQLQYLERYAEPEISVLTALDIGDYAHCLVIPAHRERPESIQQIWPHADPQLLMILVVNSWDADDDISQQMLQKLTREAGQQAGHLHYIRRTNRPDLLVVDRCHPGQLIPRPQGVGLARKIGADLALALICSGAVKSPLINSTDADVILPNNYFDLPTPKLSTAAILQPFRHYFDAELELASRLYDIAMYYYVRGLRFAGSGYALSYYRQYPAHQCQALCTGSRLSKAQCSRGLLHAEQASQNRSDRKPPGDCYQYPGQTV